MLAANTVLEGLSILEVSQVTKEVKVDMDKAVSEEVKNLITVKRELIRRNGIMPH